MNIRQFTMAMLISALPLGATAAQQSFNEGDFVVTRRISQEGELAGVKLSKSGKAKLRKLKKQLAEG